MRADRLRRRCLPPALVIGSRRSRPNALSEIFGPGGYCRRLYSARSTSRITRSTSVGSKPGRDEVGRSRGRGRRTRPAPRRARRSRAASRCPAGPVAARPTAASSIVFSGIGGVSPRSSGVGVAPPGELPHQRLRHVLDRCEAADRVAVDRRVADGELALVAGGEHQVALLVGQSPSGVVPRTPGLQVLLGQPGQREPRTGRRRPSARSARSGSRMPVPPRPGRRRRSSECSDEYDARHRDAVHRAPARARRTAIAATSAESMPPDRPSKHRAEAVLADVVAGAGDQRAADLRLVDEPLARRAGRRHRGGPAPARPRSRAARPSAEHRAVTVPRSRGSRGRPRAAPRNCGGPREHLPSGVDDERVAVEDQLVLAADHVDVRDGRARPRAARAGTSGSRTSSLFRSYGEPLMTASSPAPARAATATGPPSCQRSSQIVERHVDAVGSGRPRTCRRGRSSAPRRRRRSSAGGA